MVGMRLSLSLICLPILAISLYSASACFADADLCKQYAVEKEYEKAVEECTKQINGEIAVRHLEYSYSNRGAAYANMGQYDEAISDYTKAIELEPEYSTAFYNRAIAYSKKNRYDDAISDFGKVIELNPRDAAAYMGRGTALANKEQYDQAILDFTMAIELNPGESAAYHNRAMVYARKKQLSRAVSDRNKAIELSAASSASVAPEGTPTEGQTRKATYHVQIGAFKNKKSALTLSGKFKKRGYKPFIVKTPLKGKGILYRVLIGKFEDRPKSESVAAAITKKERIRTVIFFR